MSPMERQGISPSDMMAMRTIFDAAGVDRRQHAFHYNPQDDVWHLYRVVGLLSESQTARVTRMAEYDPVNGWVTV